MKSSWSSPSVESLRASKSQLGGKKGRSHQRTYMIGQELNAQGVV